MLRDEQETPLLGMRDQVAVAICASDDKEKWDDWPEETQDLYRRRADAALRAVARILTGQPTVHLMASSGITEGHELCSGRSTEVESVVLDESVVDCQACLEEASVAAWERQH